MTESLRDVIAKVKQQREADKKKEQAPKESPKTEEAINEPPIEFKPQPLPVQIQIPIQAPQPIQIPIPQPIIPPQPPQMPQIKAKPTDAEVMVEEIEMLQNVGIFRWEMLRSFNRLNKNVEDLNKLLGGI